MPKTKTKTEGLEELKSQAQKIWLAGLGAFAEAEKKSDKLFRSLVKRGRKYESAVRGSLESAKNQAGKSFKELETVIDRGVASAMSRAGVASRDEVERLRKEVASLTRELAKSRKQAAKATKTAKKEAKTKTKTKSTPAKARKTTKKKA